jgi:MerR family transcriptional regulator, light-induced transcriptional regulator
MTRGGYWRFADHAHENTDPHRGLENSSHGSSGGDGTRMKTLLTPKQVARAIHVSESSVKRWCDRGVIPTERTAGGHRRIPIGAMLDFLRKSKHELVIPEAVGLPTNTGKTPRPLEQAHEFLGEAFLQGDEQQGRQLLFDLYLAGHSISTICDHFLARVFEEVGRKWECGELEVYEERHSCEVCYRLLHEFRLLLPRPDATAPLALGGTPEGDNYSLPTTMVELVLRSLGWRAMSLGTNLPFATLIAAVRQHKPRLLWLSVSHIEDPERFFVQYDQLYAATEGQVALALGGRALTEPVRQRLRYSAFCDNMQHLESFAKTLQIPVGPAAPPAVTAG